MLQTILDTLDCYDLIELGEVLAKILRRNEDVKE